MPCGLFLRRESRKHPAMASGQLGFRSWLHLAYGREPWQPVLTGLLSKDEMLTLSLKPSHYWYVLLLAHSSKRGWQKEKTQLPHCGFPRPCPAAATSTACAPFKYSAVFGPFLPVLLQLPAWGSWRWAEGAGDLGSPWSLSQPPTLRYLLTGTLDTATSLNTYRPTAGRGQGLPGDDLRLGEWERAHRALK